MLALSSSWTCATEQHFEYRWDELNRIVEARRWDRSGGSGPWSFEARQRYRYDGANQRTVKESFAGGTGDSRVALYVYPGDFERRGLTRASTEYEGIDDVAMTSFATETQYQVAGARLVWDHAPDAGMGELDRNRRLTMGVSDLIGTTAASVDLLTGELLEVSTYYPNGARETLRTNAGDPIPLEPMGFTGKEADEEVGLVYFGERYLIARVGRWASPDPLHVHASCGGEALNSYHYVSGSLLQARDPLGLDSTVVESATPAPAAAEAEGRDFVRDQVSGIEVWAIDVDGNLVEAPASCAEASAGCLEAFVARAQELNATIYIYTPGGAHDATDTYVEEAAGVGLTVTTDSDEGTPGGSHFGLCPECDLSLDPDTVEALDVTYATFLAFDQLWGMFGSAVAEAFDAVAGRVRRAFTFEGWFDDLDMGPPLTPDELIPRPQFQPETEPFVPPEYWEGYAPRQVTPGTPRLDWDRVSGRTGREESSRVIYDEFGRQRYRVDLSDHMRPLDHSNPHLHEYTYGPGAREGAETVTNFTVPEE